MKAKDPAADVSMDEQCALEWGTYEGLHGKVHLSLAKSLLYCYAHGQPMIDALSWASKRLCHHTICHCLTLTKEHHLMLPAHVDSPHALQSIYLSKFQIGTA